MKVVGSFVLAGIASSQFLYHIETDDRDECHVCQADTSYSAEMNYCMKALFPNCSFFVTATYVGNENLTLGVEQCFSHGFYYNPFTEIYALPPELLHNLTSVDGYPWPIQWGRQVEGYRVVFEPAYPSSGVCTMKGWSATRNSFNGNCADWKPTGDGGDFEVVRGEPIVWEANLTKEYYYTMLQYIPDDCGAKGLTKVGESVQKFVVTASYVVPTKPPTTTQTLTASPPPWAPTPDFTLGHTTETITTTKLGHTKPVTAEVVHTTNYVGTARSTEDGAGFAGLTTLSMIVAAASLHLASS